MNEKLESKKEKLESKKEKLESKRGKLESKREKLESKKEKLESKINIIESKINIIETIKNIFLESINKLQSMFKKNKNEEITFINCIKENYLSWGVIFIAILIISPNNYLKGIITFILVLLIVYFAHICGHVSDDIFSILHRYHHENDNFFSHFVQYIIELGFPVIFLPIYYIFGTTFLDEWIIMFSTIFYSTTHNINYGYFHVNDVHSIHHLDRLTNIGPDICDIIFGTTNALNKSVENTNHYIPNVIVITIIILFFQYLYTSNDIYKNILEKLSIIFLITCGIINITCSIFMYYSIKI
jgi:hypothetical protein